MIFIFGGVYQGMEDYARVHCGAEEICILTEETVEIDFSAPVIGGLDRFVLGCVKRGENALDYFKCHAGEWQDAVLIGTDISCGVVPLDAQMRMWRDENGRMNNYLAGCAERVVRMFCGLPQVIK